MKGKLENTFKWITKFKINLYINTGIKNEL